MNYVHQCRGDKSHISTLEDCMQQNSWGRVEAFGVWEETGAEVWDAGEEVKAVAGGVGFGVGLRV